MTMFSHAQWKRRQAGGFTLIELLVVIFIILLVSAVALPTVIPALSHRQVSEAARLVQGAMAGARDEAIHANAPRGIRLLPDPSFLTRPQDPNSPYYLKVDPNAILASNRIVPIETAPDYSEGYLQISQVMPPVPSFPTPYLFGASSTDVYPFPSTFYTAALGPRRIGTLMVQEVPLDAAGLAHPPTSWFWNIRIGDKLRIGNAGQTFTIVGPMTVFNPELFINVGPPGTLSPVMDASAGIAVEFLFLVNGQDDDGDGYIDNGWDGVDNDANGFIDDLAEWENEKWSATLLSSLGVGAGGKPYTITRRPIPSRGSREVALPSNVVIDLTGWSLPTPERSRLPIDPYTGYVDILLNPRGEVVPDTRFGAPSKFKLAESFYHFWIAERSDLYKIQTDTNGNRVPLVTVSPTNPIYLPMPLGADAGVSGTNAYDLLQNANPTLPALKGERRLLTLFTRTGQLVTNEVEQFDVTNPNFPFILPQLGVRGGP